MGYLCLMSMSGFMKNHQLASFAKTVAPNQPFEPKINFFGHITKRAYLLFYQKILGVGIDGLFIN